MNYPVWQLDFAGGGLIIALVAIFHVFIAQFAVGGGLFLVMTERKGRSEKSSEAIVDYVYKHSRFFVLVTMVLGALSGIGIWFTISVLAPAATSVLIHNFVFAWGIEWLFFLTEILSLYVYYKTFDSISAKTHMMVGWIYAGAAVMSLFWINGIIDFMLTPGDWLSTGGFWDGFFNPVFWPAFFFRLLLALMIAGLFGFVTSSWLENQTLRVKMVRYCARWVVVPFLLFVGAAFWYKSALPPQLESFIFERMPAVAPFVSAFVTCSLLFVVGGLVLAIKMPALVSKVLAIGMLFVGLSCLGTFEFIREGGRKPYLIADYMYSNSILKKEISAFGTQGVFSFSKWAFHQEVTEENKVAAGREVFDLLCLSCHSIGGPLSDMKKLGGKHTPESMEYIYKSMGKGRAYMPPFVANQKEKEALNAFLTYGL